MAGLVADFSISLDGFVAGRDPGMEQPMGEGGEALHAWMFGDVDPVDAQIAQQMRTNTGAVILGKRTFDLGIAHWQDVPFAVPCFVLTHAELPDRRERSGTFHFVTAGLEEALRLARPAAGDRDVRLMGASTARQYLAAGLVDEIALQVVPLLLGGGERLFPADVPVARLERIASRASARVTHVRYRLPRG